MKIRITLFLLLNLFSINVFLAQDTDKPSDKSGWVNYTFEGSGVHLDLPKDPGEPKKENGENLVAEMDDGTTKVLIRQYVNGYPQHYDPDLSAKGFFDVQEKLGKVKGYQLLFIEPHYIDGFEARLLRLYSKPKLRQIMLIYGNDTEWVIDAETDHGNAETLKKIFSSLKFDRFRKSAHKRQTLGKNGFTFAPPQEKALTTKWLDMTGDKYFTGVEQGLLEHSTGFVVFQEFQLVEGVKFPVDGASGNDLVNGFLEGFTKGGDANISAKPKHTYKIKLNGNDAIHTVFELDVGGDENAPAVVGDLFLIRKDGKLSSLFFISLFKGGEDARWTRMQILNSFEIKK